jgi:hypothetical protein
LVVLLYRVPTRRRRGNWLPPVIGMCGYIRAHRADKAKAEGCLMLLRAGVTASFF